MSLTIDCFLIHQKIFRCDFSVVFFFFIHLYIIPPKIMFEEKTIELRAYLLEYLINFYLLYVDINIYKYKYIYYTCKWICD